MKTKYKTIFCLFSLILFLNLTSNIFGQRKTNNKSQAKAAAQQATNEARRKNVEALILQGKYQHDGSGELIYIGTITSVPALLKVLEAHPPHTYNPCAGIAMEIPPPPLWRMSTMPPVTDLPTKTEKPKPDCTAKKSYICTYSHAVTALIKITGQNFVDYQDWKNWWKKYQAETESPKIK